MKKYLSTVVGAAGMIAVITLASRVVGFIRWLTQSYTLHGGSPTAGAYAAANQIPNVLFEVAAGGALASVVVPLVAAPLAKHLRDDVNRISSALLTWTLTLLIPLAIVVWVGAPTITGFLPTPAGADQQLAHDYATLMGVLLRVFAWQIPLYGVAIVTGGILQAHRKFFWPAIAPLLSSLVVIGTYITFAGLAQGHQWEPGMLPANAVTLLAWGTTAGVAALSLPLLIPAWRVGVRFYPSWVFPPGVARRAGGLAMAGIGVLLAQQLSVVATLWAAPYGGDAGALSIWQLAQSVYFLPYAIGVVPIVTAVFPALSSHVAAGDRGAAVTMIARSTRLVVAVTLSGIAMLVAVAPAVPRIFNVGSEMSAAIYALAPALFGYGLLLHLTRVLYATDHAGFAVSAGSIGWLAVAALSVAGVLLLPAGPARRATLVLLGISHAVGLSVAAVLLFVGVVRSSGRASCAGLARASATAGVAAVIAGTAGWLTTTAIVGPSLRSAIAACTAGGVVSASLSLVAIWLTDPNARAVARGYFSSKLSLR